MSVDVLDDGWIIGIRLDADQEEPHLYYVVAGDELEPLTSGGTVVFCSSMSKAAEIMRICGKALSIQESQSGRPYHLCDLAETLYMIESELRDEGAIVLNCLNSLFDLVTVTRKSLPDSVKDILHPLADHLTFDNSLDDYFRDSNFTREETLDCMLWCIGWIATHGHFLSPHSGVAGAGSE